MTAINLAITVTGNIGWCLYTYFKNSGSGFGGLGLPGFGGPGLPGFGGPGLPGIGGPGLVKPGFGSSDWIKELRSEEGGQGFDPGFGGPGLGGPSFPVQYFFIPLIFLHILGLIFTLLFLFYDKIFSCCCSCWLSPPEEIVVYDPDVDR